MPVFQPIREFLDSQEVSSLLAENKRCLVSLPETATVAEGLQTLAKEGILSVPILDQDGEYEGALSVGDCLKNFTTMLEGNHPRWIDFADDIREESIRACAKLFLAKPVQKLQHPGELWLMTAGFKSSVLDACVESFNIQELHVHHRLYLCAPAQAEAHTETKGTEVTVVSVAPGSEKPGATGLKVSHVLSQTDVVRLIHKNADKFSEILSKTVDEVELTDHAVFTTSVTTSALKAFGFMAKDKKSSIGLVDEDGKLVGNLSSSDIRFCSNEDDFPLLLHPAGLFSLAVHGVSGAASKADLLEGKGPSPSDLTGKWGDVMSAWPLVSVKEESTLKEVLDALVKHSIHRVYVLDGEGKPVSIITLTDLLRLFTKPPPQ
uniref:CBS domain-containing protein n=1 Tax=Chromera velia CCMP2878 TaxID=1169474 RepID=A0A0G4GI98_9ALVE|mmetsp:Transcript_44284/g.87404  ORF Transcript_44284/g.87404 Transcript_44284/m.87404 type:complete len:377 (+) Transcript_44284:119-1249(+)|eukprot:Cvel_22022.t1-p1 / transcript=Cvel_22022.t1 / gene=Cvel_22022 / organism=Chromera_velia_CCMP2878 / gene_product=hypothetical protein / transcript_product=hypothetical protein / location=Cvel_scaffold2124:24305-27685(-) / protein_length=376 / sequence_SO=supercontig / SO=protein_coding / is_pseudo=false